MNINPIVSVNSKRLLASQAGIFQTKLLVLTQLSDIDGFLLMDPNQTKQQYKVLSEELLSQAEKAIFG